MIWLGDFPGQGLGFFWYFWEIEGTNSYGLKLTQNAKCCIQSFCILYPFFLMLWVLPIKTCWNCCFSPRKLETPCCTIINKPSCFLHLLDYLIESRGYSLLGLHPVGEGFSLCSAECVFAHVHHGEHVFFKTHMLVTYRQRLLVCFMTTQT